MRSFIRPRFAIGQNLPRILVPGIKTLVAASLFAAAALVAQTQPAQPASTAAHPPAHHRAHSAAARASAARHQPAPTQVTPPAPPAPDWPINDRPAPATVTWDSRGLRIQASNSSLQQILREVTTATGAAVEGTVPDQRVFGDFGPGKARDILSQLLQGAGYNILMIGDQGQGVPRQIVLSSRHAGNAADQAGARSVGNSDDDAAESEVDDQLQPQPVVPIARPGFVQGEPVRTPPQILQEQQQQLQQQQQQQPPPDSKPPNN